MITWRQRFVAAAARRIRGPYWALGRVDARLDDVQGRLARIEQALAALEGFTTETRARGIATHDLAAATGELLNGEIRGALRAVVAEEASNRRRLYDLRAESDYEAAWADPRPLVTVTVVTHNRPELLRERSLPSILAQTHTALELIVVGDHADEATEDAVRSLDDPRVTYRNLTQRLHFTDDPFHQWLVGTTMARNEANRLARGRWLVSFDDDDAMRPDCIERLLERAREDRLEAVYGRAMVHREGEKEFELGSFPPVHGGFTWASGMYHAGLRFLERELFAANLQLPGDWFLAERMLRAGVRFGMLDRVLADIYPSPMNAVRPPILDSAP